MITVQIEYTFEDYIVEEWCANKQVSDDDFEDNIHEFVEDELGIWPDSVRML